MKAAMSRQETEATEGVVVAHAFSNGPTDSKTVCYKQLSKHPVLASGLIRTPSRGHRYGALKAFGTKYGFTLSISIVQRSNYSTRKARIDQSRVTITVSPSSSNQAQARR
jgi:hypothetical protein